jgi:hypothetical protein
VAVRLIEIADCGEHCEVVGAIAEALMHGPQYNGVSDGSVRSRGERTMIETPILIVIVLLAVAAVVWWLYR